MLRLLASHYDVLGLFFHRRDDPTQMPLPARVEHLRRYADVAAYRIPEEWSGWRRFRNRARSMILRRSDTRWKFARGDYRRKMVEYLFERDPVIVHVDRLTLNAYLPIIQGRTVVLTHHGVESESLRQRAELTDGFGGHYLERQAKWMEDLERTWLPRVTLNAARSERDREALARLAPDATIESWPDGVDTAHFTPGRESGKGLAYVGGASQPRDRDALEFFAREILPRLRKETGMQALEPISWVGMASEEDRARYRELGIDLTGYAEDIRPIVRPTACYIVPLRVGGAARFKVLLAWAMGKAVVSTTAGCEEVGAVDGENILIRDDPAEFAVAVTEVLRDPTLRRRLGDAGRDTVERNYSWSRIGEAMLRRYEELEDQH